MLDHGKVATPVKGLGCVFLPRLNASFCSEFPHYRVGGFYEVLEMDRGYGSRTFDYE
jgi:hypothetical protein